MLFAFALQCILLSPATFRCLRAVADSLIAEKRIGLHDSCSKKSRIPIQINFEITALQFDIRVKSYRATGSETDDLALERDEPHARPSLSVHEDICLSSTSFDRDGAGEGTVIFNAADCSLDLTSPSLPHRELDELWESSNIPSLNFYYRAMLCTAWTQLSQDIWLSVHLSHAGIVSKRLNISSNFFHRRVATSFYSVSTRKTKPTTF